MTHPGGRPLLFKSPEELEIKIQQYFDSCFDFHRDMFGNRIKDSATGEFILRQVKPFTLGGLSVFLNCSRETITNYTEKEEFFGTIKKARDIIYAYAEDQLFQGKNVAGVIFNMKNNYGWVDKQEIDSNVNFKQMGSIKVDSATKEYEIGDTHAAKDPQHPS